MTVYWATMVYEITEAETLVRYIVHHDTAVELVFRIMVQPIGAEVNLSTVHEESDDVAISALHAPVLVSPLHNLVF